MKSGPKHTLSNIALKSEIKNMDGSIKIYTTKERKKQQHDLSGGHGNQEITLSPIRYIT